VELVDSFAAAVSGITPGQTVMVSGFGSAGQPVELLEALADRGIGGLTIISNNAGNGDGGIARLIALGLVDHVVCSFPRQSDSWHFDEAYRAGRIRLTVVPQGNLAERIRAAGAGIPAFYTPTGYGTLLAEGKETRSFDGRWHVLETALHADVALVKAHRADARGNLVYRKTARNFGPVMAAAARTTIVQVDEVLPPGGIDPEHVVTPGIFVDRVVAARTKAA